MSTHRNVLGIYIYNDTKQMWLEDDEHNWTRSFSNAACFANEETAEAIRERESGDMVTYCMECF